MRCSTLLTLLILATFSDAFSQQLQPGQRVRITAPALGMNKQAATFKALDGGVLTVTADSTMQYRLADVTRLDVYAGTRSDWVRGMGLGFVVGAALGASVGAVVCKDDYECWPTQEEAMLLGAGISGTAGAVLGGIIGGLTMTDKWEEVPLERLQLGIAPTGNGFGIGARIIF